METKCEYRNCNASIKGRRKGSIYCCDKCYNNEKKYKQREDKKIYKEREIIKERLLFTEDTLIKLKLYDKIYPTKLGLSEREYSPRTL